MKRVTIRELRSHGGEVVDRAAGGEPVIITRNGRDVAELRPIVAAGVSPEVFSARRRNVPRAQLESWRADLDRVIDPTV